MRITNLIACGLLSLASLTTLGQDAAKPAPAAAPAYNPAQVIPTDPKLVAGVLENGMKYVVMKHANPPGRAAMWIHVSTGSLNESDKQRGIAHYLEHMAFNGSEHFPPGSVIKFFESLGLTFGRHQNAFTSFNQTTYQLQLPDNKPETLAKGLEFFSDVAFRLSLVPAEIDSERQVILEEKRTRLSPGQRVQDYILERIAPGSTLGQRLPIGVEETLLAVKQPDFRDYYGTFYTPSNMTLIVVADIDEQEVVGQIKEKMNAGKAGARPADLAVNVTPYTARRAIVATDPELTRASIAITRVEPPKPPATTAALLRDQMVEQMATWCFNRRMDKMIAAGTLTSMLDAGAGVSTIPDAVRIMQASADGKPENFRAMLKDLGTELQRARLHGFAKADLEDAKTEFLARAQRAVETYPTLPANALLGSFNQSIAAGEPLSSPEQDLELVKTILPTISLKDVNTAFAALTDPKAVTFIATLPSSASPPTEEELVALGSAAVDVTPEALKERTRPTALMEKLPTPGGFAQEETHEAANVWSAWMSNNARVHYRFMDYRKEQVSIVITLAGGELLESPDGSNRGITQAAAEAWDQAATSLLSSSDITDLMVGKKVSVSGGAGADVLTLSISGSPKDLETGMQLAYLMLTDPKLEQTAFDRWSTNQLQTLAAMKTSPSGVLSRALTATVFPASDARTQILTEENVKALNRDAAEAWLKKLIATSPIEVAIVGDLPVDYAKLFVARYLGSLPSRERIGPSTHASLRALARPTSPRNVETSVTTKTDQAQVFCGFYGVDMTNVPDSRALSMACQVLTSRMIEELREKQQLVYGISARSAPGSVWPGFGMVMAGASTKPDRAQTLCSSIAAMYKDFAAKGPTEEEVSVAKKQRANSLDEAMKEPGYWLGLMQSMDYRGRSLDDALADPEAYAKLTGKELQETFAKYLDRKDSLMGVCVLPVAPATPEGAKPETSGGAPAAPAAAEKK